MEESNLKCKMKRGGYEKNYNAVKSRKLQSIHKAIELDVAGVTTYSNFSFQVSDFATWILFINIKFLHVWVFLNVIPQVFFHIVENDEEQILCNYSNPLPLWEGLEPQARCRGWDSAPDPDA